MSYKILVAEDDESIARIIQLTLEIEKYQVVHVSDGLKGLEAVKIQQFDLALLDIMLPGLDGYQLLEKMKEKGIPAIFISAKSEVSHKVTGLRLGAEDYITKPFDTIELLARVDTALRRIKKHSYVISVGDVDLDFEKRIVKKGGKVIELTPLEYSLLEKLMKNQGMLFSRNQLLDIIWGYDYIGTTRTVDTHIQKLRAKLDLSHRIKTVHKIGYRFEVSEKNE